MNLTWLVLNRRNIVFYGSAVLNEERISILKHNNHEQVNN